MVSSRTASSFMILVTCARATREPLARIKPPTDTAATDLSTSSTDSPLDSARPVRWGEVYWTTGLPGSGKTTIARALRVARIEIAAAWAGR